MDDWVLWLIAAVVFGIGEIATTGFFLAPFAGGALLAALVSALGVGAAGSWIVFLVASVALLAALRPVARRMRRMPAHLRTGTAALVGKQAMVLERIANDHGSDSAAIDQHIIEQAGNLFDRQCDDIFYFNKGRLYANFLLLRALGQDFEGVIRERGLTSAWNGTVETFRIASQLDPWVVWNGWPDALIIPNHLAAQGFYLLRARTQLREITAILLK